MGVQSGFLDRLDRLGRRRSFLLVLSSAVFLFVYAQGALRLFTQDRICDSYSYYFASVAIKAGLNPYEPRILRELGATVSSPVYPYLYPPVLAEVWRPLIRLGPDVSHQVLVLLSTLLAALNAILLWKVFPKPRRAGAWLISFVLLHAVCGPLVSSLRLGQINVLIGTCIFGALLLEKQDRPWKAGLLLAVAIVIKVIAIILLVDLVARRRGKTLLAVALGGCALILGSIAIFGLTPWVEFLSFVPKPLPIWPPLSLRQILSSAGRALGIANPSFWMLSIPLAAALGIALLPRLLRTWRRRGDPTEGWSLLLLYALMVSPMTWHHHYYLGLLPFGYFVLSATRPAGRAAAVGLALAALLRYPAALHILKPIASAIAMYLPLGIASPQAAADGVPPHAGRVARPN
jgi:hypothetical protein